MLLYLENKFATHACHKVVKFATCDCLHHIISKFAQSVVGGCHCELILRLIYIFQRLPLLPTSTQLDMHADMRFVKNFTRPDFWARNFKHKCVNYDYFYPKWNNTIALITVIKVFFVKINLSVVMVVTNLNSAIACRTSELPK